MDQTELTEFIISGLGRVRWRDDLVYDVAERGGMEWSEASALIDRVEQAHAERITRRRSLPYFLVSLPAALGGTLMAYSALVDFIKMFIKTSQAQNAAVMAVAWPAVLYQDIPAFLMGMGLAIGGTFGLVMAYRLFRAG